MAWQCSRLCPTRSELTGFPKDSHLCMLSLLVHAVVYFSVRARHLLIAGGIL